LITFGLADHCDYIAKNIVYNDAGCANFDIYHKDKKICNLTLQIPGQHNIYNALAAFTVGTIYCKDMEQLKSRLSTFKNANRRFEIIGKVQDIMIVDDYAHHPNEIKATLDAASRMADINRILVIFQPHTYSRTKELLNEFASAFKYASEVILCDIYAAREIDTGEVSSVDLMRSMIAEGVKAKHFDSFDAIKNYIIANALPKDLIITMGAGDVTKLSRILIEAL